MSSSSSLAPIIASAASKRASVTGKKSRPTFRPASQQRKPLPKVTPTVLGPSSVTRTERLNDGVATDNHDDIFSTTAVSSLKRAKKHKVSIGVAIGSSRRPDEEERQSQTDAILEEPESMDGAQQQHHMAQPNPAVPMEMQIPLAVPGHPTLQSFCSSYRALDKRPRPRAPATASVQENRNNNDNSSNASQHEGAQTNAGPVVQIINGEIVLQESSMVLPGARKSVQEVEDEFEQVVEEEGHSAVVGASYNSFVVRRAPQHWSVEETKKFFNALRQLGPDFATMEAYFENRTRKQLKRKYQMENSRNPHLIELALMPKSQVPLDLTMFNMEPEEIERQLADNLAANKARAASTPPPSRTVSSNATKQPESRNETESTEATGESTVFHGAEEALFPTTADDAFAMPPEEEFPSFFGGPENTSMDPKDIAAVVIPLAPTQISSKAKSKRPKFKAMSRSKPKGK